MRVARRLAGPRPARSHPRSSAQPMPGKQRLHRVTVFGEPRSPWRNTSGEAIADAIRLELASWDEERQEHYLAVPVGYESVEADRVGSHV